MPRYQLFKNFEIIKIISLQGSTEATFFPSERTG